MEKSKKTIQLGILIILSFNLWVWFGVFGNTHAENAIYFLDVGQGDSQLITLSSENNNNQIKILIDAGYGKKILDTLDIALGKQNNKHIDILIMTHPHLDHFGGFVEIVKRYEVGMFVSNGNTVELPAFLSLQNELKDRNIPSIILREGDIIRYENSSLAVISPDSELANGDNLDEASLILALNAQGTQTLFTGDIGFFGENILLDKNYNLGADVLKVGHHGSKNSSNENFISAVRPYISVIGVGQNRYGHPSERVLETLDLAGSQTYRTDNDGTIKILLDQDVAPPENRPLKSGFVATANAIITGAYKNQNNKTLSLPRIKKENQRDFKLVPYQECGFETDNTSSRSPVIIYEVAWMGSGAAATHEWIELKNISNNLVNLSGWQLINENQRIKAIFPQQTVLGSTSVTAPLPDSGRKSVGPFFILARSAANDALNLDADLLFTGSIRNSNEGLRLFDNNCQLIDEVLAHPKWPAGDNATKQTMERTTNLEWVNSSLPGGTPRSENTGIEGPKISPRKTSGSTQSSIKSGTTGCAGNQININSATKQELIKIRHIGETRADNIISNRPYLFLEELAQKISGIGEQRLKDIINENLACAE